MLPFAPPLEPMLAKAEDAIPQGDGWCYEPKWDGFRAVVFKSGSEVVLSSRNALPMQRYFPEVVERLGRELKGDLVLDGELIIPGPKGLDFDALQMRIHPAASRVQKLSLEIPAGFVAFDLLAVGEEDWRARPFRERRQRLLELCPVRDDLFPTPQTHDLAVARSWFDDFEGAGLDGVIARRDELPYLPGERVMVKVKHGRTADCVVGGYRDGKTPGTVGALLLGMYDEHGVLHHVGHTSSFTAKQKRELKELVKPYEGGESFGQGRTPGAPSRWSAGKDTAWTPLRPELVVEVKFDYLQGGRFRHGATFVRWRTDKPPRDCGYDQLAPPHPFSLGKIIDQVKRAE
ncbi:MAG: ATP-dependent DNA ligase [Archangiaceae bacterium]|nr:ATP-dependent DNA ligase [Archangiaceae bacterium]